MINVGLFQHGTARQPTRARLQVGLLLGLHPCQPQ